MTSSLIGIVLSLFGGTTITYAQEPEPRKEIQIEVVWSKESIENEIDEQAQRYGVSASEMRRVIACESMGSTTIQSYHRRPDGTREQSFGLVQIHLPAHPHITKAQAIDPEFAINFLAKNLSEGRGRMWTCF